MTEIIVFFLGVLLNVTALCDNVIFLDAQKKLLNEKFEAWWRLVERLDKTELALVFARKANEIMDQIFGPRHLSKHLSSMCLRISLGFLLIILSFDSLTHRQPFWGNPWKIYNDSIDCILRTSDDLSKRENYARFTSIDIIPAANKIDASTNLTLYYANSNYFYLRTTTNGAYEAIRFEPFGNGGVSINYSRLFHQDIEPVTIFSNLDSTTIASNSLAELIGGIEKTHRIADSYKKQKYVVIYTFAFYIALVLSNFFLFVISLAFCRTILREVEKSGRIITTFSLIFTNAAFIAFGGACLILFLTFISVPLFWVLVPIIYQIAQQSASLLVAFLLSSSFALFLKAGNSTKIIIFIALLPSCFALIVSVFSIIAMKWRDTFHFFIKHLLIRLAQKNPFVVLIGIILFISAMVEGASKLIHFLGFV